MKKKMLLLFVGLVIPGIAGAYTETQLIKMGLRKPKKEVAYKGVTVRIEGSDYIFNDITSKRLAGYLQEKKSALSGSNFNTIVRETIEVIKKRGINYTTLPVKNRTVKDTFDFVKTAFNIASTTEQKTLMKELLQTVYDNRLRTPTKTGTAAHTDGKSLEESIKKATSYTTLTRSTSKDIRELTETMYPDYNIGMYTRGPVAPGGVIEKFVILRGNRTPYSDLNDTNLEKYWKEQKDSKYLNDTDYARKVTKIAHVLDARGIDDKGWTTTHNFTYEIVERAVSVYEGMATRRTSDKDALIKLLKASQNEKRRITPSKKGIDPVEDFGGGKPLVDCSLKPNPNDKKSKLRGYYAKYLK